MNESKNTPPQMTEWDSLSSRFDEKVKDIHPNVADNVLIAWPAIIEEIQPILSKGKSARVLDYGCGTGGLALCIQKQGVSVDALDPSYGMISKAREANTTGQINFIHGDHNQLPKNVTYDAVASCMAFPFIENIDDVASKLFDVMSPDSIVTLTTFNPGFFHANSGAGKMFSVDAGKTFIHFDKNQVQLFIREADAYTASFTQAGFRIITSKLLPFNEEFLKDYWSPESGVSVSEPEYLLMSFAKK